MYINQTKKTALSCFRKAAAVLIMGVAGAALLHTEAMADQFSPGSKGSLRVFNWVDYIDPDVISDFESETGIDVTLETFTSTDQSEGRLLLKDPTLDLVVVYSQQVDRLFKGGFIREFDKNKIPNVKGIDNRIISRMPGAAANTSMAMPYFWGTTGVGYNAKKINEIFPDGPPKSWSMIFDPEIIKLTKDCGIQVIDSPEAVIAAAMSWLGINPQSHKIEDINMALAAIKVAAPYWNIIGSEIVNGLATGESCVAIGWNADILLAVDSAEENVDIVYFLPEEGAEIWVDSWAIAAKSANVDEAHAFVNFLLRPDIAARLTNFSFTANAIPESNPSINSEILEDARIYPDVDAIEKFYSIDGYDADLQAEISNRWMWAKMPI